MMDLAKPNLVIIVGPTAVGKSDLGVAVANMFSGEIISGDSMQVYRQMDIGTAKLIPQEQGGIVHHLIDIVDPTEDYSVADFQKRARCLIEDISSRGKLPIIVGGTGLYIRSVIDDYTFTEEAIDIDLRKGLEKQALTLGAEGFHAYLAEVDAEAASRIHPNDTKRIIRALEVNTLTGKKQQAFHQVKEGKSRYNLAAIGLNMDRELLYKRIDQRAQNMVESGLVDEVKQLLKHGYGSSLTSMQAIGYKEIVSYLKGEISLTAAVESIQRNTRRFAKRQLTWFRRDPRIKWFEVDLDQRKKLIAQVAEYIKQSLGIRPRAET